MSEQQVQEMVVRVLGEDKLPVAAAARAFGEYTGGAALHPSTVVRWISRGVKLADGRRVKLDAVKFGSKLVTSKQAVVRFLSATTGAAAGIGDDAPRTPAARNRASEQAAAELAAVGI